MMRNFILCKRAFNQPGKLLNKGFRIIKIWTFMMILETLLKFWGPLMGYSLILEYSCLAQIVWEPET